MNKSSSWIHSRSALVPAHPYTPSTIFMKRFRENTSTIAITVGFLLPTLTTANTQLEEKVVKAEDVPLDELLCIFGNAAKKAATSYCDRLARVGCQTSMAALLIASKNAYANSIVYLWDLYPRLHQRYIGQLFSLFHIPLFFSTLFGPLPTEVDVAYLQLNASPVAALEDSLKRQSVVLVADIVVDMAHILSDKHVKNRAETILYQVTSRATGTVCCAIGAAVGRGVYGERGEYWGEFVGTFFAPFASAQLCATLMRLRSQRKDRSSSSGGRHHRSRRDSDAPNSRRSSVVDGPATAAAPAPA